MTIRTQIVIIGAGYAGRMVATRLRTLGVKAYITVIDKHAGTSGRIRLHQVAAGQREHSFMAFPKLLPENVIFRQDEVTSIDADGQTVNLKHGAPLKYDYLVYTLGSFTPVPAEMAADNVVPVDHAEHAMTLANTRGSLLVVGGGLTGIECAAEIAEAYPKRKVRLISSKLANGFHPKSQAYIQQTLTRLGVEVLVDDKVAALDNGVARTKNGKTLEYDHCIWATGFAVPKLAKQCGLPCDTLGRLRVDPTLQVRGNPRIFAAGDAAHVPAQSPGKTLRSSCAAAMPMAVTVAQNIARVLKNKSAKPFRFADPGICLSLGRKDAVIQPMSATGPKPKFLSGWLATTIKDQICRMVDWAPLYEQVFVVRMYFWYKDDLAWNTENAADDSAVPQALAAS